MELIRQEIQNKFQHTKAKAELIQQDIQNYRYNKNNTKEDNIKDGLHILQQALHQIHCNCTTNVYSNLHPINSTVKSIATATDNNNKNNHSSPLQSNKYF